VGVEFFWLHIGPANNANPNLWAAVVVAGEGMGKRLKVKK